MRSVRHNNTTAADQTQGAEGRDQEGHILLVSDCIFLIRRYLFHRRTNNHILSPLRVYSKY